MDIFNYILRKNLPAKQYIKYDPNFVKYGYIGLDIYDWKALFKKKYISCLGYYPV